jgi:hypothetical protein
MTEMDETPPADITTEGRDFLRIAGMFDAPAYIRRARGMDQALAHLLAGCRRQRQEWLAMPRLRLGTLYALAGEWEALTPLLASSDDVAALAGSYEELAPTLHAPPPITTSSRRLRRALEELIVSNERFNARWAAYLPTVDLSAVNASREGYNRYYVLEKACAMRSDLLARLGFEPRPMLTHADLAAMLPSLPVPRLAEA